MKKINLSIALLAILAISCNKQQDQKTERTFDVNVNLENDFINIDNTRKQYNAHSGDFYSSIDSITQYGAGYVKKIDDSLKGYDVDIYLSAYVREANSPMDGGIAVSIFAPSGIKHWNLYVPKKETFKPNEWCLVLDTIKLNHTLLEEPGSEIKIFSVKPKGTDFLDVDDVKIKYVFHK